MKVDAVPGHHDHYRVTPTKTRHATRSSAPSCAASGHAFMRQTAHVVDARGTSTSGCRSMTAARPPPAAAAAAAPPRPTASSSSPTATPHTGATACGACHTLADAGTTGQTGPDLDKVLKGKDAAFIKRVDRRPRQGDRATGFRPDIMPPNYGADAVSPQELDALVKYLRQVTSK